MMPKESAKAPKPLTVAKINAMERRHNNSVKKRNQKLFGIPEVIGDPPLWKDVK